MRRFVRISVLLGIIVVPLFAGEAADYVGLTTMSKWIYEGMSKDSTFSYPSWQVTVDTITNDSVAISSFFTLNGHNAYERYSYIQQTQGDSDSISIDTLYENGNEVWLKVHKSYGGVNIVDTAYKMYITPLNVGDEWDMGVGGTYSLGDVDSDGINDSMIISHDTAYVVSQGSFTVPAGTYNAFEIHRNSRIEIHLSSGIVLITWGFEYEEFVPQLGMIYDSTVSVDTTQGLGETGWHYHTLRLLSAEDIKEHRSSQQANSIQRVIITHSPQVVLNGIKGARLYGIDGSCILKGIRDMLTLPHRGVYILEGRLEGKRAMYRIIYR